MTFVLGHSVFLILGLWLVTTLPFIGASSRRDGTQSVTPVLSPGIEKFHDLCPFNAFMQLVFQTPILRDNILLGLERDSDSWCHPPVLALTGRMLVSEKPIDASTYILSVALDYHIKTKRNMLEPKTYEDAKSFLSWLLVYGLPERTRKLFHVDLIELLRCQGTELDRTTYTKFGVSVSLAPEVKGDPSPKKIQLTDYIKGQLNKVEVMEFDKALEHDTEGVKSGDKMKHMEYATRGKISGPLLSVDIKRDYKSERTTRIAYEEVMKINKKKWYLNGIIIYQPGSNFYSIVRTGYGKDAKEDEWHILNDSLVTKTSLKEVLRHRKDVLWLIYVREDELDQWRTAALERTDRPKAPVFASQLMEIDEMSLEAHRLPYDTLNDKLIMGEFFLTGMNTENSLSARDMLRNFRENGALRRLYPEQDNSDSKSADSQGSEESKDNYPGKLALKDALKKFADITKKAMEAATDEAVDEALDEAVDELEFVKERLLEDETVKFMTQKAFEAIGSMYESNSSVKDESGNSVTNHGEKHARTLSRNKTSIRESEISSKPSNPPQQRSSRSERPMKKRKEGDTEKDRSKAPKEECGMSNNHRKRFREVGEDDSELERAQTKKFLKLNKKKDLNSEREKESKKHEKKEVSEDDSEPEQKQKEKAKKHSKRSEKKYKKESKKESKRDPESERKKELKKKHRASFNERSESESKKRHRSTKKP